MAMRPPICNQIFRCALPTDAEWHKWTTQWNPYPQQGCYAVTTLVAHNCTQIRHEYPSFAQIRARFAEDSLANSLNSRRFTADSRRFTAVSQVSQITQIHSRFTQIHRSFTKFHRRFTQIHSRFTQFHEKMHRKFTRFTADSRRFTNVAHGVTA